MKKDITKKLIKESLLHTADDFTDNLMNRIETRPITIQIWHYVAFAFGIFVLGASLFTLLEAIPHTFSFLAHEVKIPPFSLELVVMIFILFALNKLISLREEALKLN